MAEASVEGDKCGICLSVYTEPRLLDCYHIFCTPCLENLGTDTEDICCPLCRTKIVLPLEGISGLKLYPLFVSHKKRNDNADYCSLCFEDNFVAVKCIDCNTNLCSDCGDYHKRLKSSRNHKLIEMEGGLASSDNATTKIGECGEHKKELTLFCKPCNKVICIDCTENVHVEHEVESLIHSAGIKRDILLRKNASLKSKIPLLENYIESIKTEEANIYRNSSQMKKEMKSHATCLKELFCKTVDIMTKENVNLLDTNCRTNTKLVQVYKEDIEVEKTSVSRLQKTIEILINTYSDAKILQEYLAISRRLNEALKDRGIRFPALESLKFEQGAFGQEKVKELFGQVIDNCVYKCPILTPSRLNMPELGAEPKLITSFTKPGKVLGMVPSDNGNVWIWTKNYQLSLHSLDGTVNTSFRPPDKSTKVLQKCGSEEIWFWCGEYAKIGNAETEEYYKGGILGGGVGCCFLDNGNLIVYSPANKSLYEVSMNGIIERTISNRKLQEYESKNVVIAETEICKHLVISQGLDTVLIVDQSGHVKNTFQRTEAQFRAITTDINGNILVADYQNDILTLLSEDGVFLCNLLSEKDEMYAIDNMIIDYSGNLWLSNNVDNDPTAVKIFTYM